MVVDGIDILNERLNKLNGQYILVDKLDKIETNYKVYIAKKKGQIKDDFPCKFSFQKLQLFFFYSVIIYY